MTCSGPFCASRFARRSRRKRFSHPWRVLSTRGGGIWGNSLGTCYHGDIMGNNGTCWNFFFKGFFYFYWWGTWTGHVLGWSLDRWRRISAGILELSRIWSNLPSSTFHHILGLELGYLWICPGNEYDNQLRCDRTAKYRWNWRDPNTTIALNFYKDAEIWWNLELKTPSLKWSEIGNLLHGFAEKLWVPKFEKPLFFVLEHCFPIFPKPPVARGQMSFFFFKGLQYWPRASLCHRDADGGGIHDLQGGCGPLGLSSWSVQI